MLTSENIIARLFENFEEFKNLSDYDTDELLMIYNIMGDFALDFQNDFMSQNLTPSRIDKFFDFLNLMAASDDEKIINVLMVEIFEILSDKKETIKAAREKLSPKAVRLFQETLDFWRIDK